MFFANILGKVHSIDIINSLLLMIKGMVGILVVMFLIYLVIILLGKVFDKKV